MEIWIETADFNAVQKAHELGVLHGVATNPTIAAQSKLAFDVLLQKLLEIQGGPIAAQVVSSKSDTMIEQGLALASFSDRLMVKIPVTREGLQAIHQLSLKKIPVIATAIFDLSQAILAARAGATYIAPCFSHICEAEQNGVEEIRMMARLLHDYGYGAKIFASSLRSNQHAYECCALGLHAIALNEKLFTEYVQDHPMTVKMLKNFDRDWKTAVKNKLY